MKLVYRILADIIVVVHAGYAVFVVVGLVLILCGAWRKWRWIRSFWFRLVHLAMILVVVGEAWGGIVCPLTTWEKNLRRLAGEETYPGGFIAHLVHELLFFSFPNWVFTTLYTLFGLTVMAAFWLAPPHRPGRSAPVASQADCSRAGSG